ncbi:FadR/GntR family transcriptional regulator [Microbacterium sp. B19]|uniref:FadR/GntR family transcriptional regulator n=1 Tax=Microbacterium sp. B19 TaxID=96765 RepID=UPI00034DEC02|nr:GntR family transcriptional regulator [Microbacterium sp. B19]
MSDGTVRFEPAQTKRAFDSIIDQVRERLREGTLRPGQKLPSEREFAVQLGVSRNTVREAVRMLEIAGLVSLKKGASGGAFITSDNSDALAQGIVDGLTLGTFTVGELMEARIALDTAIARHAAAEITPAEVEELRALVEVARGYATEAEWPDRLRSHLAFEERLGQIAGNPILRLLNAPLLELTSEVSLRIGPSVGEAIWVAREHLLDALSHNDPGAAERVVRDYLENLHTSWLGHGAYENFLGGEA